MTVNPENDRSDTFVGAGEHAEVAIVVVTYNSASDIEALLADVRAEACCLPLRVVVVDNESSDGTADLVRAHSGVTLVEAGANLGYAGAINRGLSFTGPCGAVLILNPDLRLKPGAISRLRAALDADDRIGAVVPLILDEDGATYPSLRHEPSIGRSIGDAFFGSRAWRSRPGFLSEFDYRPGSYNHAHNAVTWATGAALIVRAEVMHAVGPWNETFFLYSEEIDYFRRIRESGYRIRFEPSAVVTHRLGGSGTSPDLAALMAVNRIRYAELYHGNLYSAAFRAATALTHVLRSYDPGQRRTLGVVANRSRWRELPHATRPLALEQIPGITRRGSVIVPAFNEAAVIERTLRPLSQAAVDSFIELIVVCNGCTDDTAERARKIPGAQVVELDIGSKTLALNTGDELATLWPRLYLDADIGITATAVIAVLDRLSQGDVLAARPAFRYDSHGASLLVRSYYRARRRMSLHQDALWWAGVYGLNQQGHQRFGRFPDVTGDDMFVDTQFGQHEKTVVQTDPSVWRTPSDAKSLLAILRRHHRGNAELVARDPAKTPRTGNATAIAILRTVRGFRSAGDAAVYLGMALAARRRAGRGEAIWEHDRSSRSDR